MAASKHGKRNRVGKGGIESGLVQIDPDSYYAACHIRSIQNILDQHSAYLAVFHPDVVRPFDTGVNPFFRKEITYGQRCDISDPQSIGNRKRRNAVLSETDQDTESQVLILGGEPGMVALPAAGSLETRCYH